MPNIEIISPKTTYTNEYITSKYTYSSSQVKIIPPNTYKVTPVENELIFRTERHVPKLGVMLVGWGGNNGSTVTGAVLANSLGISWETKDGVRTPDYFGSLFQSSTISLGNSGTDEIYVAIRDLVPMIHPNDIIFDGWDISSTNLSDAMTRAKVLDIDLQKKLRERMKTMKPRPSIYDKDFIAANQSNRVDNVIGGSKSEQIEKIREDIKDFKIKNNIDKVIVLWTANTERYSDVETGLNDTWDNLSKSIREGKSEISPSTLFAVASVLEGCAYINGAPQNTFVPGVIELAEKKNVFIGGDDFKSGQTKLKSVLVDFLISAGLKPVSIVSYNHLGNNDGKNLSAPEQFRSKEISKSNVVDDMVASNKILYKNGEKPDHCVVIKYVPYVGDSKRAMDEYISEIMLGGHNTLVIHNTCEDSLLAAPIILDLVMLTELFQRVKVKVGGKDGDFVSFHSILSILSLFLKAPLVRRDAHVVNAFFKQRFCIENILRALIGLPPINHMDLENKMHFPDKNIESVVLTEKQTESKKNIQIDLKNLIEIPVSEGASF